MTDSPDSPPRIPLRKWWLWIPLAFLGVVLAFLLLGSVVVSGRAASRWKEFLPREAALKARILGRDPRRAPLEGVATEGNAWKAYVDAARKIGTMTAEEKKAIWEATGDKPTPEAETRGFAILEAHAADLQAFRLAAKMGTYRAEINWEDGFNARLEWLASFRESSRVLALSARKRLAAGDIDGAIEDVATLFQLGVDSGRSGGLISWLVGGFAVRLGTFQALDILEEPALSGAQAERIEKLVIAVESTMAPISDALEGERLTLDESCKALAEGRANLADFGGDNTLRIFAWRQGFSYRIVAADIDEACLHLSKESARVAARPWDEAEVAYSVLSTEWKSSPLLSMLLFAPATADRNGRAVTARLRLLRAFAHERGTGGAMDPLPVDPFTLRPLHRRETPGGILWWSEFLDCDDDGGKGKFQVDPESDGDLPAEWVKK